MVLLIFSGECDIVRVR